MAVSQQPALCAGAVELGAAQVGGVEHRLHGVLAAAEQSAELPPVPAELAQLHQRGLGDEAQRTLAAGQAAGDVGGVVGVVLPPLAAAVGQLGGVGDVDPIHALPETVDEPLDERAGFDRQLTGARQVSSQCSIFSTLLVLIVNCRAACSCGIDRHQRHRALVQIDSHKRLETRYFVRHNRDLRVRGRITTRTRGSVPAPPGPYTVLRSSSCWS